MIYKQEAKDTKNTEERLKSLICALKEKRILTMVIEPASVCNLSCSMCDLHSGRFGEMTQEKGIMNFDLYKKIVNQVEDLNYKFKALQFHGNGEPLLNKCLAKMVQFANAKDISDKYILTTNGTAMSPRIFDELLTSGLNEIHISLDVTDKATYARLKGKDYLDKVANNIDYAISRVIKQKQIRLIIKCAIPNNDIYGFTENEMHAVINKYRLVAEKSDVVHVKAMGVVVLAGGMVEKKVAFNEPCEIPFYSIYIKFDGRVSTCCADIFDQLNIGTVGVDSSLEDILYGEKLRRIRRKHLTVSFKDILLCKYCENRTAVKLAPYRDMLSSLI